MLVIDFRKIFFINLRFLFVAGFFLFLSFVKSKVKDVRKRIKICVDTLETLEDGGAEGAKVLMCFCLGAQFDEAHESFECSGGAPVCAGSEKKRGFFFFDE